MSNKFITVKVNVPGFYVSYNSRYNRLGMITVMGEINRKIHKGHKYDDLKNIYRLLSTAYKAKGTLEELHNTGKLFEVTAKFSFADWDSLTLFKRNIKGDQNIQVI